MHVFKDTDCLLLFKKILDPFCVSFLVIKARKHDNLIPLVFGVLQK